MDEINQMIQALQDGNMNEANQLFSSIFSQGSDEELYLLAEELFQLGFLEETKKLYSKLLESYPGEGEIIVLLAETLTEMDKEDEAVLLLEQIDSSDSFFPRSLLLLADLYQMQGLYEVSEHKLILAKEKLPEEPIIDFALGELYAEEGRLLEATKQYQKLLDQGMEDIAGANLHQRMADSLSSGGAFEEALPFYEKAVKARFEVNNLFGYGFTAFQAAYYSKAIELFEQVKELDPDYQGIYLYLAKAYEYEEQLHESLNAAELGMTHDEFNKEIALFAGRISLKLADENKAERYLREAIALDPGYLEAALTLNKLLLLQDKYDEVIEIFELMQKEGEEDPQFYWDAARAYEVTENYELAFSTYQQAYTYLKEQPEFLREYGNFLVQEGKRKEAIEVYSMLLKHDPSNDEIQLLIEGLED